MAGPKGLRTGEGMATYPTTATREHKFWPPVGRIDNVHGDRHLILNWGDAEEESG